MDLSQYKTDDSTDLAKLIGKKISHVIGNIGDLGGGLTFHLSRIYFEDGTFVWVEGVHDDAYIIDGTAALDENLMWDIFLEENKEEEDDSGN